MKPAGKHSSDLVIAASRTNLKAFACTCAGIHRSSKNALYTFRAFSNIDNRLPACRIVILCADPNKMNDDELDKERFKGRAHLQTLKLPRINCRIVIVCFLIKTQRCEV